MDVFRWCKDGGGFSTPVVKEDRMSFFSFFYQTLLSTVQGHEPKLADAIMLRRIFAILGFVSTSCTCWPVALFRLSILAGILDGVETSLLFE